MSESSVDVDEVSNGFRFRIADISPIPDDEVLAAITAALNEVWPRPVPAPARVQQSNVSWRFGERRWKDRQIPRRTWGRTG